MDILELRSQIQESLIDELGTYTLTGGATTPAIAVLDAGELISDRTVTGLEIIVRRSPISDEGKPMFDCVRFVKVWQVFLIQWGGTYTLSAAKNRLIRKFPNARAVTVKVKQGSGVREQVSFRIPDDLEGDDWL